MGGQFGLVSSSAVDYTTRNSYTLLLQCPLPPSYLASFLSYLYIYYLRTSLAGIVLTKSLLVKYWQEELVKDKMAGVLYLKV